MRLARNVAELRAQRGMSVRALSTRMAAIGRPLLASAVALGVNPSRLLLGLQSEDEPLAITPTVTVPAWAAWQWMDGYHPLPTRPGDDPEHPYNTPDEEQDFYFYARPATIRRQDEHVVVRAARDLFTTARRVVFHATKSPDSARKRADLGLPTTLAAARRNLVRVADALDEIEEGPPVGERRETPP